MRLAHLDPPPAAPIVICNDAHRFLVAGQIEEIDIHPRLALEPIAVHVAVQELERNESVQVVLGDVERAHPALAERPLEFVATDGAWNERHSSAWRLRRERPVGRPPGPGESEPLL